VPEKLHNVGFEHTKLDGGRANGGRFDTNVVGPEIDNVYQWNLTVSSPQHRMGRAYILIGHHNDYLHAFSISIAARASI
jgi:hypothetical protein